MYEDALAGSNIYVRSTITLRKRFNYRKSSMRRYEQGDRKMAVEHGTHIFLAQNMKVYVMLGLSLLIKKMLISPHKGLGGLFGYVNWIRLFLRGIECEAF